MCAPFLDVRSFIKICFYRAKLCSSRRVSIPAGAGAGVNDPSVMSNVGVVGGGVSEATGMKVGGEMGLGVVGAGVGSMSIMIGEDVDLSRGICVALAPVGEGSELSSVRIWARARRLKRDTQKRLHERKGTWEDRKLCRYHVSQQGS